MGKMLGLIGSAAARDCSPPRSALGGGEGWSHVRSVALRLDNEGVASDAPPAESEPQQSLPSSSPSGNRLTNLPHQGYSGADAEPKFALNS